MIFTLSPQGVTVVPQGRRAKAADGRANLESAPEEGMPSWRPALDALAGWLGRRKGTGGSADVVLSNHFVRYLVVPWNATVAGTREEEALAAARFQQVYGEIARTWAVRISPAKPGSAMLAAAAENGLVDAVAALFAGSRLRLRSVQPALMAACNLLAASVPANAWVAFAEPGQLLLGLQRDGQWHSLRSRPLNGVEVSLAGLIEQERLLLGVEPAEEKVYLHQWGSTPIDASGLRVERWSGFEPGQAGRA
jgi:hypothetical protein